MYGSCVARDTIEFAMPGSVELIGYVARHSLISTGSDASGHLPDRLTVPSKFQERMIRADFSGALFPQLQSIVDDIDVLLWDLADERHGVHRFADGTVVTRSIDTIRVPELEKPFAEAEHIPFNTADHFAMWSEHVARFERLLHALNLFDRTVVLEVPWAVLTTEGKPSPWSMGVRAAEANQRYWSYYARLRELGFRMISLPEAIVRADPQHRWGLAPFHYTPEVYREVLRQLSAVHGLPELGEEAT